MRKDWAEERVGALVGGHFTAETLLGVGGMGAVYGGRDLRSGAPVALKLLAPQLLEHAYYLERFQREAAAAASVGVAGVPEVFEMGHDDKLGPFMVMERLDGRTLADYLKEAGALPVRESMAIARGILETLGAVHAAGVVHRDLKPGNVFLVGEAPPWTVKILDFGVARFWELSSDTILTLPGSVVGTPRYMPPEQARDSSRADPRCDVYAAGALFYSCLSGLPPYHQSFGTAVAVALLMGPPDSISKIAPTVPTAVCRVVEDAMARDPVSRFPSARDMLEALTHAERTMADEFPTVPDDQSTFVPDLDSVRRAWAEEVPRRSPRSQRIEVPIVGDASSRVSTLPKVQPQTSTLPDGSRVSNQPPIPQTLEVRWKPNGSAQVPAAVAVALHEASGGGPAVPATLERPPPSAVVEAVPETKGQVPALARPAPESSAESTRGQARALSPVPAEIPPVAEPSDRPSSRPSVPLQRTVALSVSSVPPAAPAPAYVDHGASWSGAASSAPPSPGGYSDQAWSGQSAQLASWQELSGTAQPRKASPSSSGRWILLSIVVVLLACVAGAFLAYVAHEAGWLSRATFEGLL